MMKPWLVKKETSDFYVEVMGAKVYLKPLKYGKAREALNVALTIDTMTGKASMDSGLLATLRALYQIKDWEITDENDEKLPINLKTLDEELGEDFVEEMITKINEKAQAVSEVTETEKK